jgi:glutamate-1-semialdehyde 2,1-aminomutase
MPGGNSRTTVFLAPYAPYAAQGWGSWIVDADGDRRLDLLNNYTALIHGHAHPAVSAAATERLTVVPSMAGRSIGEKFQG